MNELGFKIYPAQRSYGDRDLSSRSYRDMDLVQFLSKSPVQYKVAPVTPGLVAYCITIILLALFLHVCYTEHYWQNYLLAKKWLSRIQRMKTFSYCQSRYITCILHSLLWSIVQATSAVIHYSIKYYQI